MAVVVWYFAGGGHSELRVNLFFQKHFHSCRFERKLPVRQRGPLPAPAGTRHPLPKGGLGHTGEGLHDRLRTRLQASFKHDPPPDLILVMDDLDCHDQQEREAGLQRVVQACPERGGTPLVIALAAPEIESWLLADWENSFGKQSKFKACSRLMQHHLSQTGGVVLEHPETFGQYDPAKKSCHKKLSEAIEEAYIQCPNSTGHFSKADDTPLLLDAVDPDRVAKKCPIFQKFWSELCHYLPLPAPQAG